MLWAKTGATAAPCASIAQQTDATVIAYEPPASFTICRAGHVEQDVVVGRPVYVEIVARPGEDLYQYLVHGQTTRAEPTGLRAAAERIDGLHAGLHALSMSSQTIAEAGSGSPPAAGSVDRSRMLYLGVATPRFHEVLAAIGAQLEELPAEAGVLARWCAHIDTVGAAAPALVSEVRQRCSDPRTAAAAIEKDVSALTAAIDDFHAARDGAREALLVARTRPDDSAAQSRAVSSLDEARRKALAILEHARQLAPTAASLASEALLVRELVRGSVGALRPSVPHYLARYSRAGMATLEIEVTPAELLPGVDQTSSNPAPQHAESTESIQTFRFHIVGLHFLDLEAGIGAIGGVPLVPALGPQGVLQGENADEFVGLALVELEPARFLWPDRPMAGFLRFPVIGIPFTRDPTRNFFGGLGVGWTEVGSISAGPYVLRELGLNSGAHFGQTLAQGQTLASVTNPALQVGYFVSASVDLVGLVHLIFPPHEPVIEATTGREIDSSKR